MRTVAVVVLLCLAVSLAPLAYAPAGSPSTGKTACLLSLNICNHGGRGLSSQSMPFIPVLAGNVSRMEIAHFRVADTRDLIPLPFLVLKEHPPETSPLS